MNRILLFVATSFLFQGVTVAQDFADSTFITQIQQARALVTELKESQSIPGISIAVARNGRIIWQEAIGLSDVENGTEVTTTTKFRTGSISKTITALALGKLYDAGMIDWSDPVSKYLSYPDAPEYTFSIRQLAGHLAGIRHYKGLEFFSRDEYNTIEESMEIFRSDKLLFEPGTKYQYTTYGYSILGRLIEVVSGQSYVDYMSSEVLIPLGMQNTILEDAGLDESAAAVFYRKGGKREAGEVNLSSKWAGGGFLSTPTDLVTMINLANKLVSFSTLVEMITPQQLPDGTTTGYGIGFRISKVQSTGQSIVHHGGRIQGARPYLLALLDQQLVIAICTNSDGDYGLEEVYALAKLFGD